MDRIGQTLRIMDEHGEVLRRPTRRHLDHKRSRHYKITLEQFEAMLAAQNSRCYICGQECDRAGLHIDHCHATGRVRKLLCPQCNLSVGYVENTRRAPSRRAVQLRAKIRAYINEHA